MQTRATKSKAHNHRCCFSQRHVQINGVTRANTNCWENTQLPTWLTIWNWIISRRFKCESEIQSGKQKAWYLLEGELVWIWEGEECESVSWLLQGLSQPDRRRDWRPRPRSVTPGEPLDDGISWEPGTQPQLGKSILLLPTAASSDSFWSEIQFRGAATRERKEEVLEKNSCFSPRYRENSRERLVTRNRLKIKTFITTSPPTLADGGANLLLLCPVRLPCISVRITDPPSSMWHGCWCTRTPLLMTSAFPHLPASLPNNCVMKNSCQSYWLVDRSTPLSGRHGTSVSRWEGSHHHHRCCRCLLCVSPCFLSELTERQGGRGRWGAELQRQGGRQHGRWERMTQQPWIESASELRMLWWYHF